MKHLLHLKSNFKYIPVFLGLFLGSFFSGKVFAYYNPGTPINYVSDYASILSTSQEDTLNQMIDEFEKESSNEIAVVTIDSLQDDTIENFAVELFEDWGIGKENQDNGVLFLVAVNDRKMRIEVGYGLEGALTDVLAKRILDKEVTPFFKSGDYYSGILTGTQSIISATRGEYTTDVETSNNGPGLGGSFWAALVFGVFVLQWLISIFSRTKSWWLGGVVGFILGLLVSVLFNPGMGSAKVIIILTLFGLFIDFLVSQDFRNKTKSGRKPSWWAGGSTFGGGFHSSHSGGGSSFGGFSGGSSGGGGASGGW